MVTPGAQGVYSVTIKNGDDCTVTLNTDVLIDQRRSPLLEIFNAVCADSEPIELPAVQDGLVGVWSGQNIVKINNADFFNPVASGNASITFTPSDIQLCTGPSSTTVFVSTLVTDASEIRPSANDADNDGEVSITIQSNASEFNVEWSGPTEGNVTTATAGNLIVRNLPSGIYTFSVTDKYGCVSADTVRVQYQKPEYHLPNTIISQGTDQENSIFYLKGNNIQDYDLKIFNRWGNIVADMKRLVPNDATQGWNVQQTNIGQGVFVYVMNIRTIHGESLVHGSFTVL